MTALTICYSTHRPETLGLTARIMQTHDCIFLEEPTHPEFQGMLAGRIDPEVHMMELDLGYPVFALKQYRLLQLLSQAGKQIEQVEPYLEHLVAIQEFFADGNSPADLDRSSEQYLVYCSEKEVTGLLIEYYNVVKGDDFCTILKKMQEFAIADAARFLLRDSLRAREIVNRLQCGNHIYIESGSIHLALYKYLKEIIPDNCSLHVAFIEREAMRYLGVTGNMFSPGDELTLSYIFGKKQRQDRQDLLCAQALIYSKLVRKDEIRPSDIGYPHTRNDLETTKIVRQLSITDCRELFYRIRSHSIEDSWSILRKFTKN